MKYTSIIVAVGSAVVLSACASKSYVVRSAPSGGVQTSGLNVLFSIIPFDTANSSGTRESKTVTTGVRVMTAPREQAEKLRDNIQERLIPQLRSKGLAADYASIHVLPGVSPTPINQLFANGTKDRHLLLITPISERRICTSSCATKFTLSVSLKSPKDNRDIWTINIEQGIGGNVADWIPNRNDGLIDDVAKSVLEIVIPKKSIF